MSDECFLCGAEDDLEEHHKLPQRFGGVREDWNIVTLCNSCYTSVEKMYPPDFWNQAVRRYEDHIKRAHNAADGEYDERVCGNCGRKWTPQELQAGAHTCR